MKLLAIIPLALGLSACVTPVATGPTAQQRVYQAEGAFSAALSLAVAYEALPPCPSTSLCADGALTHKITLSARAARAALQGAEDAVRAKTGPGQLLKAVSDAEAAVASFKDLVPHG